MNAWTLPFYFNPLLLGIPQDREDQKQIALNLFDYLSPGNNTGERMHLFLERHGRVRALVESILVLPMDQRLADKLIAPLRSAFGSFLLGNFLGTLALCGMISEMLAIFAFEIHKSKLCDKPVSDDLQERVFGRTFERLGQDRRIAVLSAFGIINEECAGHLEKVRKLRNHYLHYWSKDHEQLENDAYQVFCSTIMIVKMAFPQEVVDGVVVLGDAILDYLRREGCFEGAIG